MKKVLCKDCDEPIDLKDDVQAGEVVECQNCGAEMEVVNIEPLEVSLIEEEK